MVATRLPLVGLLFLAGTWSAQDAAGQAGDAEPLGVSFSVGTILFGDLQSQPVRAERLDDAGQVTETVVLRRELGAASGQYASASVVVPLGVVWRGRLGAGLGRTRLRHGFEGPDAWTTDAAAVPLTGGRDVSLVTGEAALRFVLPSRHALRPYLELGATAERWRSDSADGAFPELEQLSDGVTRVGAHTALGGRYPLTDRLQGRLQASLRWLRTPVAPVAGGREVGRSEGMVLSAQAPMPGPFADRSVALVRVLRLDLGLSYSLGEARVAPPDRSEPDESPSVPGR
jgi:hypothetical protein